jgi:hypothetical protein
MSYLIFSRSPQEGELPLLGKLGPQIIRYHLSHPEPEPGGRKTEPVIRIEIRVPVGDSSAYGAFTLTVPEAKASGLLDYEPTDEGFIHRGTGLRTRTLQMDTSIVVVKVTPVEGRGYLTIVELGFSDTPRFKSWGNYSKKTEKPKVGAEFANLLAKARGETMDEPQPPEPAPEEAPPPAAKRRRVAI